jgi:hypothetical protein
MATVMQLQPTLDTLTRPGSHRVTISGDRAVVHDLELFVGFDPSVDKKGSRFEAFDAAKIAEVVKATSDRMERGQRPKIHIEHNPDDPDEPGTDSVGTVLSLERFTLNGAPAIRGDVEMSVADFDSLVGSNRYPTRSAEIFSDNVMASVALLGSRRPARPLPDTKFSTTEQPERLERDLSRFATEDTAMPTTKAAKKAMDDDKMQDVDTTDEDGGTVAMDTTDENGGTVAKAGCKAKAASDEVPAKFAAELAETKAANAEMREQLTAMQSQLTREKFTARLDKEISKGLDISSDLKDQIIERVVKCSSDEDREAEYQYGISGRKRLPIGRDIPLHAASVPGDATRNDFAIKARANKLLSLGKAKTAVEAEKMAREENAA